MSPTPAPAPAGPGPADDRQVRQVLEAYRTAVDDKDVDKLLSLYASDVRVFDMWGRWHHDGLEAWRSMATEWFGSLGSERVRVEFDDLRVTAADGLAVAHGFVTYTGLDAAGHVLRSLQDRHTWVLRPHAGAWLIVHEHSSGPVDVDTGKVLLQR